MPVYSKSMAGPHNTRAAGKRHAVEDVSVTQGAQKRQHTDASETELNRVASIGSEDDGGAHVIDLYNAESPSTPPTLSGVGLPANHSVDVGVGPASTAMQYDGSRTSVKPQKVVDEKAEGMPVQDGVTPVAEPETTAGAHLFVFASPADRPPEQEDVTDEVRAAITMHANPPTHLPNANGAVAAAVVQNESAGPPSANPVIDPQPQQGVQGIAELPVRSFCGARWPARLLPRLQKFLRFSDAATSRYAVSTLPTSGTAWKAFGEEDNTNLLTIGGRPLTVWIVGEIGRANFVLPNGEPRKRISISVKPIHTADLAKLRETVVRLASYKGERPPDRVVWASRRQTRQSKGEQSRSAFYFKNSFDATSTFGAKQDMEKYEPAALGENDLVLLECNISRWKCDGEGKTTYAGPWELWRTGLELVAVSMLFVGPDTAQEPELIDDNAVVI